jgi:hypothetical protein
MTVTLELKPEVEALINEQASAQGIAIEEYIRSVLENVQRVPENVAITGDERGFDALTPEGRAKAWEEWVRSHDDITGPQFLDDSRESIYGEREEKQL